MNILLLVNKLDFTRTLFNRPILEYGLKQFEKHNIKVYSKYSEFRRRIPEKNLLNAKTLSEALELFKQNKDNFLLITKLAVSNIDYEKLETYHNNHGKKATIVLRNLVKDKAIPIYKLNENKEIITINKKRYVNCGISMLNSSIDFTKLKTLTAKIQDLIDQREVKGFIHSGYYNLKGSNDIKGFKKIEKKRKSITKEVNK